MAEENKLQKKKSFFSKKEGKTGLIFLFGGVASLFAFRNPILNFFREVYQDMMASMTGSIVGFGVLGLLVFMATDKRARNLIVYGFKSLMRWITGLFTELDPIKILESHIAQ